MLCGAKNPSPDTHDRRAHLMTGLQVRKRLYPVPGKNSSRLTGRVPSEGLGACAAFVSYMIGKHRNATQPDGR
jgi:hypothetical protein